MLTLDTYVIHEKYGICYVKEIQKNIKVGADRKDYFVLKPVYNPTSSVYIPVTGKAAAEKLRPLPTADEIYSVLASNVCPEWIDDGKARSEAFSEIMAEGDRTRILGMVKCLINKKEKLQKENKKLRLSDESILKNAEKMLTEEFSFILGTSKENVAEYINNQIK